MLPKFNIHWPGRNTGQVMSARTAAEAVLKACKKPTTGAINKLTGECNKPVSVVELTGKDLMDAIKGKWIRSRSDGSRNSSTGDYTFRPHLKKLSKSKDF
jgi:hypothetical protein